MAITYQTGSLAANLKLIAVSKRHGKVIRADLIWQVQREDQPSSTTHTSREAFPTFSLQPGLYKVTVFHGDHEVLVTGIALEQNSERQEIIYIPDDEFDPDADYFVKDTEFDAFNNHDRRKLEREGQREFAVADGPIKDPFAKREGESGLQAHPLLAESVQFDGADANVTQTIDNEEALGKTLELQHQLNAQPSIDPTVGPKPQGGM